MTTTANLLELATAFRNAFETGKRNNGSEYVFLRDGSPEWMRDACYNAHHNNMPNDAIYEMIQTAVQMLVDGLDADDARDEAVDILSAVEAPIYTHELLRWLSTAPLAMGCCDEYIQNNGTFESTFQLLQEGWFIQFGEVSQSILNSLESQIEA
jgi:hypothetical protein